MPELRKRGVSYEAQMGPVYDSGAAVVARATDSIRNAFSAPFSQ